MSWTDDRVELLTKMWAEGRSASQIAKELGAVTRNAVIGKVHRLGLASRNTDSGAAAAGKESAKPVDASPAEAAMAVEEGNSSGAEAPVQLTPETVAGDPETPVQPNAGTPDTEVEPAEDPGTERAAPPATSATLIPGRRPIVPAGQPLPPQPSANEISPEALATVREVEKTAKRLHLMELTERTCKWPIGDPATEEFWFCGLPSVAGKPYCEAHVSVAFQPMQSRRDRRR